MYAQNDPFISDAYRNDYLNCSRSELQDTDNVIRMCLENASDRKFSKYVDELLFFIQMSVNSLFPSNSSIHLMNAAFSYMSVILMYRSDEKKLKIIADFYEKNYFKFNNFSYFYMTGMNILDMLMLCCLKKEDDDYCRKLIDRWIDLYEQQGASSENDLFCGKFILHPLYPLMITESLSLVRYYFMKFREMALRTSMRAADIGRHFSGFAESAIYHRQKEFLRVLWECGYDPSCSPYCLGYILADRANPEYISDLWEIREISSDEYMSVFSEQSVQSGGEFADGKRYLNIPCFHRFELLDIIFAYYGEKGCGELFKIIQPSDIIYEDALSIAVRELSDKSSAAYIQNFNDAKRELKVIDQYTPNNVTVVMQSGKCILRIKKYLKNKSMTYDLRENSDLRYGESEFGKYEDIGTLVRFFSDESIIFNTESLTPPVTHLLMRNSGPLTKALIEKGAFSDKNIVQAIDFAVENKLYNSLSQINKAFEREEEHE